MKNSGEVPAVSKRKFVGSRMICDKLVTVGPGFTEGPFLVDQQYNGYLGKVKLII